MVLTFTFFIVTVKIFRDKMIHLMKTHTAAVMIQHRNLANIVSEGKETGIKGVKVGGLTSAENVRTVLR